MEEINLAANLARYRRSKGVTQEELAAHMEVSKAAVSKWEKAQSLPDITLLPRLAAYFNVSVDELLGYAPRLTREEIWRHCRKLSADFVNEPYDVFMGGYREKAKKYYACFPFLFNVAILLINHHVQAEPAERQREMLREAEQLCGHIAADCGQPLLAKEAVYVQSLCRLYLCDAPGIFALLGTSLTRRIAFSDADVIARAYQFEGNLDKAQEVSLCGMYEQLLALFESTTVYISLTADDFPVAERAFQRTQGLINLYALDTLDPNTTMKAYIYGADMYCRHTRWEEALTLIEKCADLCLALPLPVTIRGDSFFNRIDAWLADYEINITLPYDERMVKQNMLQGLEEFMAYPAINDDPRYKSVIRRIRGYAQGRETRHEA